MRYLLLAATLLLPGALVTASEEEFLGWSEVRVVSEGSPETGRVVFSAAARDGAVRAVEAEAFGKKYTLDERQCRLLSDFPLSSLVTTHEAGYEQLGGHTVYFKFVRSFRRNGEQIEARLLISISRGKGLEVGEPPERIVAGRQP